MIREDRRSPLDASDDDEHARLILLAAPERPLDNCRNDHAVGFSVPLSRALAIFNAVAVCEKHECSERRDDGREPEPASRDPGISPVLD